MDRSEAIYRLRVMVVEADTKADIQALDLAIEALQGDFHCPKCGTIVRDGRQYHDLVYRGEAEPTLSKTETDGDTISRQAAIEAMWKALYAYEDLTEKQFMEHEELELGDWFQHRIFVQRMHEECMKSIKSLPPVTPKPVMTEEVREALMRLTMCAREECTICKYENNCGFDKQVEMATENMNTILNAFDTTPTERTGEWIKNDDYVCDQCGYHMIVGGGAYNFCPNCGAKMGGDTE